jgi:hypothetical protein
MEPVYPTEPAAWNGGDAGTVAAAATGRPDEHRRLSTVPEAATEFWEWTAEPASWM